MKCAGGNKIEEAGVWIGERLFPGWKCSNCGKHIILDVFAYGNFCPNCGQPKKGIQIEGEVVKEKVNAGNK